MRLSMNPVPCIQTAARAIAVELNRAVASVAIKNNRVSTS
jgi:hypothetical protein